MKTTNIFYDIRSFYYKCKKWKTDRLDLNYKSNKMSIFYIKLMMEVKPISIELDSTKTTKLLFDLLAFIFALSQPTISKKEQRPESIFVKLFSLDNDECRSMISDKKYELAQSGLTQGQIKYSLFIFKTELRWGKFISELESIFSFAQP